uniref:Ig-like domain-containing protein n=1 Tax=Suricata suricatta TaxID=37032 RepID=A0A673THP1_SURSU
MCYSMTILLLGMLLTVRGTGAQSVTQPDAQVFVSEGARLELRCNFSYSGTPYLFWYVQHPNQGLQFLLKYTSGNTLVKGINGFEAEFKRHENSFHLRKSPALGSDTAKYFCAVSDTVPGTAGGAEHKLPATLQFSETQGHSQTCF